MLCLRGKDLAILIIIKKYKFILLLNFFKRGEQNISKTATGLLSLFILFVIICAGLAGGNVIHWLDFLYYCSYVKLTITIIKYVPQVSGFLI